MTTADDCSERIAGGEEFVWRFVLTEVPLAERGDDPLVQMVRAFLADFSGFGFLTASGQRIQCDGFAFLNDPQAIHSIFQDDSGSEGGDTRQSP